jgi:hypothetical protein
MRPFGKKAILGAGFVAALALSCTYAPDFADGTLQCSAKGECPQGYACRSTTCWRAGSKGTIENFPGHWLFQAGSMQTINCLDGSKDEKDLSADYVDIEKSGSTGLRGSYYCDWDLTLDASATKTDIVAGQSCQTMSTGTDASITRFTWKGTKFVFTTSDGKNATLQGEITTDYTTTSTKNVVTMGTCALKISGTLAWSQL